MEKIKIFLNSFVFWGAWIIIPILMEIVPALGSLFLLIRRRFRHFRSYKRPDVYPDISIIIPVYNSADTLHGCLESIYNSTYPRESIRVFLANNEGQDGTVGHDRPGDKLVDIAVMRAQSEGLHTGFQHFFPVWVRADGVFIENQITTLFVVIIIVKAVFLNASSGHGWYNSGIRYGGAASCAARHRRSSTPCWHPTFYI